MDFGRYNLNGTIPESTKCYCGLIGSGIEIFPSIGIALMLLQTLNKTLPFLVLSAESTSLMAQPVFEIEMNKKATILSCPG